VNFNSWELGYDSVKQEHFRKLEGPVSILRGL